LRAPVLCAYFAGSLISTIFGMLDNFFPQFGHLPS
jgi:hypothetical protein